MLKKIFYTLMALLFVTSTAAALEVNEDEIKSAGGINEVVFENYTGPHSVINTVDEIKAIGSGIGKVISANVTKSTTAGNSKYSVIHCVDSSEKGKLDADILVIGAGATVDHIKNLRRIISAYLTAAYGYSEKDADTVATFVTVYNAVYRGNLEVFNAKYKKVVTDNLTADKAGLALSYKEWPGKSQIIIPLSELNGGLSTVDTSVISDKEVVTSMQGENDKGVDARKELVDIKEREADKASEKAQAAQKKATDESAKLKEEQKKTETAKKQAETAKKEAEAAQKKAEANPSDKKAQQEAAEKKAEAAKKEAVAEAQEKKTEAQEKKTEEAKKEASEAQSKADTKRTEAQNERTTIAQDQQTLIKQQQANANATVVYGLKSVDELGVLSELVKVNADNGNVIKESPVTVIRSRTIYEAGNYFIAVAGSNIGNGAVKLVQLDKDNMEIVKESNETLSETSVLVQEGSSYYVVIKDGSNYVVAKYNGELEQQLKSNVAVKSGTPVTITSKGLLVTASNGKPVLLKKADLSQVTDSANAASNANAK